MFELVGLWVLGIIERVIGLCYTDTYPHVRFWRQGQGKAVRGAVLDWGDIPSIRVVTFFVFFRRGYSRPSEGSIALHCVRG